MSEYIHEIVLQEYLIENIASLNLTVQYKSSQRLKIIEAKFNKSGTFWDLNGKLVNGTWIPIEVEWISSNFILHKHHKNPNLNKFKKDNGVLIVLRKNKELSGIQQISIFDCLSEAQFKKAFSTWFKQKSPEYIDETLKTYMVGSYKREIPRIILYPLSQHARANYFPQGSLYKKHDADPFLIGFKAAGYNKNAFIRDLQTNDICLFIAANGKRGSRKDFIEKIKNHELSLYRLTGYRVKENIINKQANRTGIDDKYWPDEIKNDQIIYPYICRVEERPFLNKTDIAVPYIESFSENTWEAFRSCIQYGEYREISPLDFTVFTSSL